MPVEGPPRMTLTMTKVISAPAAEPIFSCLSENPGPLVAVMALTPPIEAPITAAIEAISSSICTNTPSTSGNWRASRSAISDDGVIGYPAKKRQPAAIAPNAQAWLPEISFTALLPVSAVSMAFIGQALPAQRQQRDAPGSRNPDIAIRTAGNPCTCPARPVPRCGPRSGAGSAQGLSLIHISE